MESVQAYVIKIKFIWKNSNVDVFRRKMSMLEKILFIFFKVYLFAEFKPYLDGNFVESQAEECYI